MKTLKIKYVFFIFYFLTSSSLYSGNTFSSKPTLAQSKQKDPEPVKKELMAYLNGLKLEGITTEIALVRLVQDSLTRDLPDKKRFPLLFAPSKNLDENTPEGQEKANDAYNLVLEAVNQFLLEKKSLIKQGP